jgi:hypothetical protein
MELIPTSWFSSTNSRGSIDERYGFDSNHPRIKIDSYPRSSSFYGAGNNMAAAHVKTETLLKKVLQRSLGNLFNHCFEFYLKTRRVFPKNLFNHSVRESRNLLKIGLLSVHPYFSAILAHPRNSFGLAGSSSHDDHFCNYACEGLRCHFLRANRVVFAWQHVNSHGPPKESSSVGDWRSILPVQLHFLVHDGYYMQVY